MAEDDFFKNLEKQMYKVTGGDGLTDEERRIYFRGTDEIGLHPNNHTLTAEEWEIFKNAKKKIEASRKAENNPQGIRVNIRPGVPLKIKFANGKIDDGWTMGFNQHLLHLGQVRLEKNATEIVLSIKDLAEQNDLNGISSIPENVMEYGGFRILNPIKVKATEEIYLIHQFVTDNGEVKIKVETSGSSFAKDFRYKLLRINEIDKVDKIPERPLPSPDSKIRVNRREAIKAFGTGAVAGLLGNFINENLNKTNRKKGKHKNGQKLK
jgi:hypothetical protein